MPVWTEGRRKKQAEAIRRNKPWEKSTGPRTKGGKARSRLNAVKHGEPSRAFLLIKAMARENMKYIRKMERLMDFALNEGVYRRVKKRESNELLKTP